MKGWNPKKYFNKIENDVNQFLKKLYDKKITHKFGSHNITFIFENKETTMSYHSFFRCSGRIASYIEGKEKNSIVPVEFTYKMYLDTI
jgi:hypothetical protein